MSKVPPRHEESPLSSLFRPEVLVSQEHRKMGAVRLAQPLSGWIISLTASLIAAALLTFVYVGNVTKKAKVAGVTVPRDGTIAIQSPVAGVLMAPLVREGQFVAAGTPLFEVSMERQGQSGELAALVAKQLDVRRETIFAERRIRTSQDAERSRLIEERLANNAAETLQIEAEIALAVRREQLASKLIKKLETLQNSGFVSDTQVQQKQEELIDTTSRLSALARAKLELANAHLGFEAEKRSLANSLSADMAQIRRMEAGLQQEVVENQARKATLILARQSGAVTTMTYHEGQAIAAGQTLATLVPQLHEKSTEHMLELHLFSPSRAAGFVAPGQVVKIRFQAFPYQKFGLQEGVVMDVSPTPFAPTELPTNLASTILANGQQNISGFNSNEALYRIKVRLLKQSITAYGREQSLKPGMTVEADIIQDRRKIWEWIAEPLLAAMQR